jgi:hypothetical protein
MEVLVPVHFGRMELAGWVADFVVLRFIFSTFLFPVYFLHFFFRAMILIVGLYKKGGVYPSKASIAYTYTTHIHTHTFAHPKLL